MDDVEFRSLALALPEVTEQDHHGFPSWRLRGKILATLPEPGAANLMVAESAIREAVAEFPDWCQERWWGSRLAAVTVRLVDADAGAVRELLVEAWRGKAPVVLAREHPELG
jgi:hypothetical protein